MNTKKLISRGFTLVELLTVIAIIGILAAILFPVVGKVRETAAETAGRAQFSQWSQGFELFRQEYGYYPMFGDSTNDLYVNRANSPNHATGPYDGDRFYETLTGRVASGTDRGNRVEANDDGYEAGNTRAAQFYTFGDSEVEEESNKVIIRDHSGNGDIVVLFDRTQNGIIEFGTDKDYPSTNLPTVYSVRTNQDFQPTVGTGPNDEISPNGIRASVVFYSAGHGNRLLMSWK